MSGSKLEILIGVVVCTLFTVAAQLSELDNETYHESYRTSANSSRTNIGNHHKPTFKDCASYWGIVIPEEEPMGLHVLRVEATDEDPVEAGGVVTYSIIKRQGLRDFFVINSTTGQIYTNFVFDRDEPMRQKEVYLTVKASDNGRPVLADICTFKITISDINDNAPIIDKNQYEEKVSEDLAPMREVMRVFAYDIDDGDNARLTYELDLSPAKSSSNFEEYFRIDNDTGVIYLKQSVASKNGNKFKASVQVRDNPINKTQTRQSQADITITVVDSDKQLPVFINYPRDPIHIPENMSDFEHTLAIITAQSNINSEELQFELVRGQTAQTNKDNTFKLTPSNRTSASISLGRVLDYETVTDYTLTVRVINKDSLSAAIPIEIKVLDVNDEIPAFIELVYGSVLENEPPGAAVMQVSAIDRDGTPANSIVSYELAKEVDRERFEIDPKTGVIRTKVEFDREENAAYYVDVIAKDNSPSALLRNGEPNSAQQTFSINIEDKNDNPPIFQKAFYRPDNIPENVDIGYNIIEVVAIDKDTASVIQYSIISGNEENAFDIQTTTGRIFVKSALDYEKTKSYNLTIQASDGQFMDNATVAIFIDNINDELPIFEDYNKNITDIEEESIPDRCIITLVAYDPDISDRDADQKIEYVVDDRYKHFLSVDKQGCVMLIKKLDRDKPNGAEVYQAFIHAFDDNLSANAQTQSAEILIMLRDINDNAPFLIKKEVVWQENQEPGEIATLEADDFDSPENGAPFFYQFADNIDEDKKSKFNIINDRLHANVVFDREQQKYYDIPIAVTDSGIPPQTGISILRVIIGDVNDNPAKDGESEIFVYNYKGRAPNMQIGRVFVDDPDDWDLRDKNFQWKYEMSDFFQLNNDDGMLTMLRGTPEGNYTLKFEVTEEAPPIVERHTVDAIVEITVKEIPEEAVVKSGSIRLNKTSIEEFVTKIDSVSKKDILQAYLAKILNTSRENVDVFTILSTPSDDQLVDVRFSAHGSPYYAAERLNNKVNVHHEELAQQLNVEFVMISISECINESKCGPENSCMNQLSIMEEPAIVFTNRTSFVGVKAIVEALCECVDPPKNKVCLNGGTFNEETNLCDCLGDFEGPNCEALSVGFQGNGWAMYPTFNSCNKTKITLEVAPNSDDGLIFYAGPVSIRPMPLASDFISLEIIDGFPKLILNYGSGTTMALLKSKKINDGASHTINIVYEPREISLSVDYCHSSSCVTLAHPEGTNSLLNVNGPLQIGGTRDKLEEIATLLNWAHVPTSRGFAGCIRNFTYNDFVYDLGVPGEHLNARMNCNFGISKAVTFGIDSNFLVAILVCVAILLILLLAVVVHRRKENNWNEKDNDDIRENIITYTDEGGENDAAFDMSCLKVPTEEPPVNELLLTQAPKVPDIRGFVDHKKDDCDRDPNNYPFDDVRYYAYEGDGNSTGSLSSLASCTDDGDLKFNYLSSFGPRFRKLADMYGEDPSDEDSQDGGEESWC